MYLMYLKKWKGILKVWLRNWEVFFERLGIFDIKEL